MAAFVPGHEEQEEDASELKFPKGCNAPPAFKIENVEDCVMVKETCGYVKDVNRAHEILAQYEKATDSKFVLRRYSHHATAKTFGNIDASERTHCILWQNYHIPFTGVPLMILGTKYFSCEHGPDGNLHKKRAYKEKTKDNPFIKRRFLKRDTKKLNCPASVVFHEIAAFPDHQIKVDSRSRRTCKSTVLRQEFKEGTAKQEKRIYFHLPPVEDHVGHKVGKLGDVRSVLQTNEPDVMKKIDELVHRGVRNVAEMKLLLNEFVIMHFKDTDKPDTSNRKCFPTLPTIRSRMYNAIVKLRRDLLDLEAVHGLSLEWSTKGDSVFFRPSTDPTEEEGFQEQNQGQGDEPDEAEDEVVPRPRSSANRLLFVHQKPWQSRLLMRYGQQITFLDTTYRSIKYGLPLFQVAVKTNVDYQVVAVFVVQDENTASISEALEILKGWNPYWNPHYLMTDLCKEEIHAIEQSFPDCHILLCSAQREKAWEEWVSKPENGVHQSRYNVLKKLRAVANSPCEDTLATNLQSLYATSEWKNNEKYRRWFASSWLRHKLRWVCAYRTQRLLVYVNTNNGLEKQNNAFKHQCMTTPKMPKLGVVLKTLLIEYLPGKYESYIEKNSSLSGQVRRYNPKLPAFLHNRPDYLVNHCMKRLADAEDIAAENIQETSQDPPWFMVGSSAAQGTSYAVSFRDMSGSPTCECGDWKKWHLPCKHVMALILCKKAKWEDFDECYRDSAFLTIDDSVVARGVIPSTKHKEALEELPSEALSSEELRSEEDDHSDGDSDVGLVSEDQPDSPEDLDVLKERCKDLFLTISSLMYKAKTASTLQKLEKGLEVVKTNLEDSLTSENGV